MTIPVILIAVMAGSPDDANGEPLFLTPVSAIQDSAVHMCSADFNGDGHRDIAVAAYRSLYLFLGDGDRGFTSGVVVPLGASSYFVAAADFNADGKVDVVATLESPPQVAVLPGRGDGTFAPMLVAAVGGDPRSVVVGDFNADGRPDVATANRFTDNVSVLLGLGDGTFLPQLVLPAGDEPMSIAAADVNGDTALDLVVANRSSDDIAIFLGNGAGSFTALPRFAGGADPTFVTIGLIDGDARLDLIVVNPSPILFPTHSTIGVFAGNGNGTFRPLPDLTTQEGTFAYSAAVLDLDGDQRNDLAAQTGAAIAVFKGNGAGGFAPAGQFQAGAGFTSLVMGDFDSDGVVDAALSGSNYLSILRGRGDGTFAAVPRFEAGADARSVAIGDFDEDGRQDLVVANGGPENCSSGCGSSDVSILPGRGDGTFSPQILVAAGNSPQMVAVGDFDRDGHEDLAVANNGGGSTSGEVSVLRGHGDGAFDALVKYAIGSRTRAVSRGDFNGDGDIDLAFNANVNVSGDLVVLFGQSGATFGGRLTLPGGPGLAVADLDADGRDDILIGATPGPGIRVYLGQPDGLFTAGAPIAVGAVGAQSFVAGHFNNDGFWDLAIGVPELGSMRVKVLLGTGPGTFGPPTPLESRDRDFLATADVDADGDGDIIATGANVTATILLNNGDGTFAPPRLFYTGGLYPRHAAAGDFDGDGRIDLAVALAKENLPSGGAGVLLNHGPFPDSDGDGVVDPSDLCTDRDGDGTGDPGFPSNSCAEDNCPAAANPSQADADADGIGDVCDGCPFVSDAGQVDSDDDGAGDACDLCPLDPFDDGDGDGRCGDVDACPATSNPEQRDLDADGVGDACDDCPVVPDPVQADSDGDGAGDVCDRDRVAPLFPVPLTRTTVGAAFAAMSDVNGDGFPDMLALATVAPAPFTALSVSLGRGDGTFGQEALFQVAPSPALVRSGDFNGDGRQDVAVVSQRVYPSGDDASILLGNGDGTFAPATTLPIGRLVIGAAVADFNGDGRQDLACVQRCRISCPNTASPNNGTVTLFMMNASGSWTTAPFVDLLGQIRGPVALDTDGDGKRDLALGADASISVLRGRGDGTFLPEIRTAVSGVSLVQFLSAGDFNRDGRGDIAASLVTQGAFGTFLGQGDGSVRFDAAYGSNLVAGSLLVADFDGDGDEDLAADGIWLFLGNGRGGFSSRLSAASVSLRQAADVDADGRPDLVAIATASGMMALLPNRGGGHFDLPVLWVGSGYVPALAVGDFDGDSVPDAAAARFRSGISGPIDLQVILGRRDGPPLPLAPVALPAEPKSMTVADFNGDGHADLALAGAQIAVYRGRGDGQFDLTHFEPTIFESRSPAVADFNRDGKLDLAFADNVGVGLLFGRGDATFAPSFYVDSQWSGALAAIDLNSDGIPDLSFAHPQADDVAVLLGRGDGSFQPAVRYPVGDNPLSLAAIDLNRDGAPDLAIVNYTSGDLSILLGSPTGSLTPQPRITLDKLPRAILSGDVDADGGSDLIVGFDALHVAVLRGRPDGTLGPLERFAGAGTSGCNGCSHTLALADFDRDRRLDVLSASSRGVTLLPNRGAFPPNQPPSAAMSAPPVIECDGVRRGTAALDGSGSNDPEGMIAVREWWRGLNGPNPAFLGNGTTLAAPLPFGANEVTLRVFDVAGASASASASIEVRDTLPPVLSVAPVPAILWPPNHRLAMVDAVWQATDVCDPAPSMALATAQSNEPDDAPGLEDGATSGDIVPLPPSTPGGWVRLRAERARTGTGRAYDLGFTARDFSGNVASSHAAVTVPLNRGSGPEPIIIQVEIDPTGATRLSWTAVPEAQSYDVISGRLSGVSVAGSELRLGDVRVIARGIGATFALDAPAESPPPNEVFFYLVQYRDPRGGTGFGTEPAPRPQIPTTCSGGCP